MKTTYSVWVYANDKAVAQIEWSLWNDRINDVQRLIVHFVAGNAYITGVVFSELESALTASGRLSKVTQSVNLAGGITMAVFTLAGTTAHTPRQWAKAITAALTGGSLTMPALGGWARAERPS